MESVEPERMSERGTPQEVASEASTSVEALSRKYHSVLVRYFSRRRLAFSDAQDLAQEVFARLARPGTLDGIDRAGAYLFTTAANLLVEFHRYRLVRSSNPPEDFCEAIQRAAEFTPERLLEGRQELELIMQALRSMPERMRNVFVLARLENIPRAEIAARLGIAKRTVEQDLTTATAYLAERRRRL
jgi:RNA polymerase sigma-70 factor (ECF subfamily)